MSNAIETTETTESFTETPVETVETVETPVAETTEPEIPPQAPVELRFEYQPTDEQGRPMGGKQVILYTDPAELAAKLVEQNTLILRKLRAETRKNRLGIPEQETIGDEAPRFAQPISFKAKELTADEKVSLAFKLGVSPEDFDDATDELFETKFGVAPSVLIQTLQEIQEERIGQKALAEAEAFKRLNPDFYICPENSEAITNWIARYNLAPVRANFQRAFDTLRAAGILTERPSETVVHAPLPAPQPALPETVVEETPPAVTEPAKPVSRVPVSLSRSNTEETGAAPAPAGSDIVYEVVQNGQKRRFTGLAAVDAMSAAEYRKRVLSDPNFAKKVEKLEAAARNKRS